MAKKKYHNPPKVDRSVAGNIPVDTILAQKKLGMGCWTMFVKSQWHRAFDGVTDSGWTNIFIADQVMHVSKGTVKNWWDKLYSIGWAIKVGGKDFSREETNSKGEKYTHKGQRRMIVGEYRDGQLRLPANVVTNLEALPAPGRPKKTVSHPSKPARKKLLATQVNPNKKAPKKLLATQVNPNVNQPKSKKLLATQGNTPLPKISNETEDLESKTVQSRVKTISHHTYRSEDKDLLSEDAPSNGAPLARSQFYKDAQARIEARDKIRPDSPAGSPAAYGLLTKGLPPMPKETYFKFQSHPKPPLLADDMNDLTMARHMVIAFNATHSVVYGKPAYTFRKGKLGNSRYYRNIVACAHLLRDLEMSPVLWCTFAFEFWAEYLAQGKKGKKQSPPVSMIFSEKTIADRRGWCLSNMNSYTSHRFVIPKSLGPLMGRWSSLKTRFRALPCEGKTVAEMQKEIAELVEKFFPGGWERKYRQVHRDHDNMYAKLCTDVEEGCNIWVKRKV